MANVSITEFQGIGYVAPAYDGMSFKTPAQAPFYSDKTTVEQTLLTVAGQSAPFNQYTNMIRVHTDAPIKISIGSNPGATANSPRLAANQTEYFTVTPGHKLSFVTSA